MDPEIRATVDKLNDEAQKLIDAAEELKNEEVEMYHWSEHLGAVIDNIAIDQEIDSIPLNVWASPITPSEPGIATTIYLASIMTATPR
ncbi:hypothetical protein CROQUDRAFT_101718 [Cronartium quercuum f. sp. fusiforme G11]|uniref:Uncharacterized protein n=1 Tax=Cronartium quercuum f. sp. fusiforme G11 TaxID=708437 RepID=A0A9P6N558_9BASI|nr:hypothetical protein CROQUDRAFT_101718 [Cronartium quercuum f. sp. fusiforme G11]